MHILLTGLNHETAPLEIREQVSFSKEQLSEALPLLADRVGEGVILSTCNRTEVYTVAEEPPEATGEVRRFLANYHGLDQRSVDPNLYDRIDADAVTHLFRVSCGLDSMIVGESQILGQVRAALTAAAESHTLSSPLSRLFHRAIRTGRKVREQTDVGKNPLSMSYAGVQLARRVMGNLAGLRVLLIGAGEAGQLVAQALRTTGASDLMIANRTHERSEELVRNLGGTTVRLSEVGASLSTADIVIAATEAPDYILTEDVIASADNGRQGRPLFLFDLSVPRNIEPRAGSINGVSLFNIDDLSSIAEENLEGRKEAAVEAERVVEGEVDRFISWWDSLEAVPLIKDLRQRAEQVRKRELDRALRMIPDLSPKDAERLDAMTRSIINRLLHDPTISLKQRTGMAHLQAARDLFRLWDGVE